MRKLLALVILIAIMMTSPAWSQPVPEIGYTSPGQNALNVSADCDIFVHFNEDMDSSTMDSSTLIVYGKVTGYHPGAISYDSWYDTVTFDPDSDFAMGEVVTVTITDGIESAEGVPLAGSHVFQFTVEAVGGSGIFGEPDWYQSTVQSSPGHISAVDLDGDSDIDLVTMKDYSPFGAGITTWINDGLGAFDSDTFEETYYENSYYVAIQPAELDRDQDNDVQIYRIC